MGCLPKNVEYMMVKWLMHITVSDQNGTRYASTEQKLSISRKLELDFALVQKCRVSGNLVC